MDITKPVHGAPNWDVQLNQVIDVVNTIGSPGAARKYATAQQPTIATGTVVVGLAGIDYNVGSGLDLATANRITVLTAGLYWVAPEIFFANGSTDLRQGQVTVNGATVREFYPATFASNSRISTTILLNLAANDQIGLTVYTAGGPDLQAFSVNQASALTVARYR